MSERQKLQDAQDHLHSAATWMGSGLTMWAVPVIYAFANATGAWWVWGVAGLVPVLMFGYHLEMRSKRCREVRGE